MISQEAFDQMKEGMTTHKDDVLIDMWYPQCEGRPKHLVVGLMDVRCADDIRISYDFDRDGWKIEVEVPTWNCEVWVEKAFVPGRRI